MAVAFIAFAVVAASTSFPLVVTSAVAMIIVGVPAPASSPSVTTSAPFSAMTATALTTVSTGVMSTRAALPVVSFFVTRMSIVIVFAVIHPLIIAIVHPLVIISLPLTTISVSTITALPIILRPTAATIITRRRLISSSNIRRRRCVANVLPIAVDGNVERRSEGTIAPSEPHLTALLSAANTSSQPPWDPAGNRLLSHKVNHDWHVIDFRFVRSKEGRSEVLVIHILHEAIALGTTRYYTRKDIE